MGIVKILTRKTLKRHLSGGPGNLMEFFEMVEEQGEKEVNITLEEHKNKAWDIFNKEMRPSFLNCIITKYQSPSIQFTTHDNYSKFVEPCENWDGTMNSIKRGDFIKYFIIARKNEYSKAFPELTINLQNQEKILDSIKEYSKFRKENSIPAMVKRCLYKEKL